jgi:copper(I)-binding protein
MFLFLRSVLVFLFLSTFLVSPTKSEGIEVSAWSRATPPGGATGAIYGRIANNQNHSVDLVSVEVGFAQHAMIHETEIKDGVARMRYGSLVIPAAGSVLLEPGSTHIMLMGLSLELSPGCRYPFRMIWSDGSSSDHDFLAGELGQMFPPDPALDQPCF